MCSLLRIPCKQVEVKDCSYMIVAAASQRIVLTEQASNSPVATYLLRKRADTIVLFAVCTADPEKFWSAALVGAGEIGPRVTSSKIVLTMRQSTERATLTSARAATSTFQQKAENKHLAGACGLLLAIPDEITPGFAHVVGIMLDDATGWWDFSGISSFPHLSILVQLYTHLVLPSSALKTSLLRVALSPTSRNDIYLAKRQAPRQTRSPP
ncbi:hypothetical protein PR048_008744 [Dryococelus australis]|uniref:Uncharacterized protein n=1 Tax=Dryococelus australis TaxID=614101 RepID=A0ABQ9HY01_9NEOP|nr:hypothetical protein PR048_008744 [Dryococelus australis]